MILFTGVNKKYADGTVALRNINLKIEKGEFVFLIGASGCGKSSLIKLLIKEEDATSGLVRVNGYDLSGMSAKAVPFFRRSLGIVFQDFRLLNNKTVFENIAFALRVTGASPKTIRRHVPMAMAMVGLTKKADAYPGQLSGGEQQRVAIARAIANNPVLLIADEPTGNLDPDNSWEIMRLLQEINSIGTTVLVATHERAIVNAMSQRVIAISDGRIIRDERKGIYEDEGRNS
ncbi:MAG TPA: cell division ATP-binding protein FtsE [Clostridiales bacterium]|nr:cell division ATP-binding protein FtsE [Clostridiales bacterium]